MTKVARFISELENPDPTVRSNAAWELGNLGPASAPAAAALVTALNDPSVRDDAGWALVKIGRPAIAPLIGALDHDDSAVRVATGRALWKLAPEGGSDLAESLGRALGDPDPEVRMYASWGLGRMGPAAASQVLVLLQGLDDASPQVRVGCGAAITLLGVPNRETIEGLMRAVESERDETREISADTLWKIARRYRATLLRWGELVVLERLARERPRSQRDDFREIAAAVRLMTREASNLPVPAEAPRPSTRDLPTPAGGPDPPTESLPRIPSDD